MNAESVEMFLARSGRTQQIETGASSLTFKQRTRKENQERMKRRRGPEVAAQSERRAAK